MTFQLKRTLSILSLYGIHTPDRIVDGDHFKDQNSSYRVAVRVDVMIKVFESA